MWCSGLSWLLTLGVCVIYYIILLLYIIHILYILYYISYTILSSSSVLPSSSIFFCSILSHLPLPLPSSQSSNNRILSFFLQYSSPLPSFSSYLPFSSPHPLIPSPSQSSVLLSSSVSLPYLPTPSFILYVSAFGYPYLYSDTYTQSLNYKPTW